MQNGDAAKDVKKPGCSGDSKAGYQYAEMPGDTVQEHVAVKRRELNSKTAISVSPSTAAGWTKTERKTSHFPQEIGIFKTMTAGWSPKTRKTQGHLLLLYKEGRRRCRPKA